jgi:hypothetical protein
MKYYRGWEIMLRKFPLLGMIMISLYNAPTIPFDTFLTNSFRLKNLIETYKAFL